MMNSRTPIRLTDERRLELERQVKSQTLDVRAVRRAIDILQKVIGVNRQLGSKKDEALYEEWTCLS